MATTNITVFEFGSRILYKTPKKEHPSMAAASSSSCGNPMKNCLSKNMEKEFIARNDGTTSGR